MSCHVWFPLVLAVMGGAILNRQLVQAYSTGAPVSACTDLRPGHRENKTESPSVPLIAPQTGTSSYVITPSKTTVSPSESISVELKSNDQTKYFEGFLIQVREVYPNGTLKIYGTFTADTNHSKPACSNQAITHTSDHEMPSVKFTWKAPDEEVKNVRFIGTVVKGFSTFYMNVTSDVINVINASVAVGPSILLLILCVLLVNGQMLYKR